MFAKGPKDRNSRLEKKTDLLLWYKFLVDNVGNFLDDLYLDRIHEGITYKIFDSNRQMFQQDNALY